MPACSFIRFDDNAAVIIGNNQLVNVLLALTPLASAFGLTGLTAVHWFTALGIAFSVIPVGEMYKLVLRAVTRRKKLNLKIKSAEA